MKQKDFYNSTAWRYCTKYVLLFYADKNHIIKCETCNTYYQLPDKRIQSGHYIRSDKHKSTAFDFKNILPQCYRCNKYFSGQTEIMARRINEIHGEGTTEMLNIKKHNICKLGKFEMDYFAEYYKQKFQKFVKVKGNPWKK